MGPSGARCQEWPCRLMPGSKLLLQGWNTCGGGVEYLHRDPASRRRRRKVKSRIWDSKIWSDLDPRLIALTGTGSNSNRKAPSSRQRERSTNRQLTVIKIWSKPQMGALFTSWLTVGRNIRLRLRFSEIVYPVWRRGRIPPALRVVGGDEKQSLEPQTVKIVESLTGFRPQNDSAGEDQQQL
jgi:hypothetical protein